MQIFFPWVHMRSCLTAQKRLGMWVMLTLVISIVLGWEVIFIGHR
jgi:hypothetical protein